MPIIDFNFVGCKLPAKLFLIICKFWEYFSTSLQLVILIESSKYSGNKKLDNFYRANYPLINRYQTCQKYFKAITRFLIK